MPRARGEPVSGVVVGKMIVRGVEYVVRLRTTEPTTYAPQGGARFGTRVSGKDLYAETWEALYKLAMLTSKEAVVKVNVPLLQLSQRAHSWSATPIQFKAVTLTGKHQKNGNYLIRHSANGKQGITDQVDRYRADDFYLPMSAAEQAEGLRLIAADRAASEAAAKWKRQHEASLGKLYEAAEAEAMEKLDREEGR